MQTVECFIKQRLCFVVEVAVSIKEITEDRWDQIVQLEAAAYSDIAPESKETLRSKWLASPDLCFVFEQEQAVVAYLLAHSWHSIAPPNLFEPLAETSEGKYLFIHDLVVATSHAGLGLGRMMVQHLFNQTSVRMFESALLVAVQHSQTFWAKQGFSPVPEQTLSDAYGPGAVLMHRPLAAL